MTAINRITIAPRVALTAAILTVLYSGSAAFAAADPAEGNAETQSSQPAAGASSEPTKLEAMVVTANKRVEKLESVPQAISVLNSEMLERNNVRDMTDVVNLTPSLTQSYSTTPDNFGLNMRGIGTVSLGIAVESDVAVVIDDIPYAVQYQAFADLLDPTRVEILKGPQSTLIGKNSIAGAVNITTKPTGGPNGGNASFYYTSDGEWRAKASLDASTEKFSFRIAASDSRFPGNVENLTTGKDVNGNGGKTLIAKFDWHPLDNLDVEFSPHYNKAVTTCCAPVITQLSVDESKLVLNVGGAQPKLPATSVLAGIPIGPGSHVLRNDYPTGLTSTDKGAGLRAMYTFANGAMLTAITSYDKYIANDYRDQDFVDVPTLLYAPLANKQPAGVDAGYIQYGDRRIESHTDELRLISPDEGPVKYVAGLWYGKNAIDRNLVRGYPGIAYSAPVEYFATTYNQNYAVFGQASWEFQPNWTVVGGLRFNHAIGGFSFAGSNLPPAAAGQVPIGQGFQPTMGLSRQGDTDDAVTGRLSLQHQFNEDLMAYATYSTGYKGQAYDLTSGLIATPAYAAYVEHAPVKAETAKMYELGLKDNFFDGRATLNADLFQERFYNYQQSSGIVIPGTDTFITTLYSLPYVQSRGAEADMSVLATDHLLLNGAISYTQVKIGPFPNGPCYSITGKTTNFGLNDACIHANPLYLGSNTQDLTGQSLPNAPKVRANLGGRYDIPLPEHSFNAFATASVRYQSAMNTDLAGNPLNHVAAFSITNLSVGIASKDGKYRLTGLVNNVFDRHYGLTGFNSGASLAFATPTPGGLIYRNSWVPARDAFRYYGVRFDWDFH